jgi:hypothetical protein
MSDHDPTHGANPSQDAAPPTQAPSTDPAPSLDSLLTMAPSSYPNTRFEPEPPGASTPFQVSTDTYATANPDATQSADREVPQLRGWEWKYVHHLWHGELRELKGHTDILNSVSWSPDGSRIATASSDNTARVWDARTGAELQADGR